MTQQTLSNLAPWEIYDASDNWPQSASGLFLAEAVQIVGNAVLLEWSDHLPGWLARKPLPPVPPVYDSFAGDKPIKAVYDAYSDAVRAIISCGRFAALELTEQEWIQSAVKVPGLDSPIPACLARALAGDDAADPITYDHWEYASIESSEAGHMTPAAKRVLDLIKSILTPRLIRGKLECYIRPCGSPGQAPTPLPPSSWEVDDIGSRLAWGGLNLDDPNDTTLPPTHWIFVSEKQLRCIASEIEQQSFVADLPRRRTYVRGYSPDIVKEVAEILSDILSSNSDLRRADCLEECRKAFGANISPTNWDYAWHDATLSHPEKRLPGRPRSDRTP